MYQMTQVRITSKTTPARDKAYKHAFDKRYELQLWGWSKSKYAFVTGFTGKELPSDFKQKILASNADKVEIKRPGAQRYSPL
jgi:hypothetical protein